MKAKSTKTRVESTTRVLFKSLKAVFFAPIKRIRPRLITYSSTECNGMKQAEQLCTKTAYTSKNLLIGCPQTLKLDN